MRGVHFEHFEALVDSFLDDGLALAARNCPPHIQLFVDIAWLRHANFTFKLRNKLARILKGCAFLPQVLDEL